MDAESQNQTEPIAIIGIGLRLPGGVSTTDEFWDLLINGKDGRCRVPSERYNVDAFRGKGSHPQFVTPEHGYFIQDAQLGSCDASVFSAAEGTDPQQVLLSEVVYECLENAGQIGLKGTNTGVFVGSYGEDWHNIIHTDKQSSSINRVLSAGDFVLSNRISKEFDLRGPSVTTRTACSASLSALHMACQALQAGDCPTAIVGGTSIILEPSMTLDMSRNGALSPSGICRTFDASADGFARGDAINAILIKPLKYALRDGDSVRGVIRSTALSNDGKLSRPGVPSRESQVAAMRRAYEAAGIDDVSQTPFIECHGTGTPVGDPIEVAAVAEVFGGKGNTYIGSVKPNVGHGEGASGISGIIKAVLALENRTIPPNIFFTEPGPRIPLDKYKLKVPVQPVPWPKDRQERISVNSFGIGGSNGHVIVDSAASFGIARRSADGEFLRRNGNVRGHERKKSKNGNNGNRNHGRIAIDNSTASWPRLVAISASSAPSLEKRTESLKEYLKSRPGSINDVAHTLGQHRIHLAHRRFYVSQSGNVQGLDFSAVGKVTPSTEGPKVAYVFTGQGAQWNGMGRALIQGLPSFLQDVQAMDKALQKLKDPPQWKIENLLNSSDKEYAEFLKKPDMLQPVSTAIQIGLVNFLNSCGVEPSAVIGHSSGEIAAAYAAGALTMSEAIITGCMRGRVAAKCRLGAMAVVGMSREALIPHLNGVQIACENGPTNTTISGDVSGVKRVLGSIQSQDPTIFTRLLPVEVAYHSDMVSEQGKMYEKFLTPHLSCNHAAGAFYSSATGQLYKKQFDPAYWKSNFESPVLFHGAMKNLLKDNSDIDVVLEVGTHPSLQGPLRDIIQESQTKKSPVYIPTLHCERDPSTSLVTAVGEFFNRGSSINFEFLNGKASLLTDLPNYPWNRTSAAWVEPRLAKAWRYKAHPHHELLGSRGLESSDVEPVWRNMLSLDDVPWLADHQVAGNVIMPAAGFIAIMGEAITQVTNSPSYVLRDWAIKSALVVPEKSSIELMTSMRPARLTQWTNSSWYELSIFSYDGSSWVEVCVAQGKGKIEGEEAADEDAVSAMVRNKETDYPRKVTERYIYHGFGHKGLNIGPQFQSLHNICTSTNKQIASATVSNELATYRSFYNVHPTAIDGIIQLCGVAVLKGLARTDETLQLPVSMKRIVVNPSGDLLHAEAGESKFDASRGAIALSNSGEACVIMEDIKAMPLYEAQADDQADRTPHACRLEWRPDIDCLVANDLIHRQPSKRSVLCDIERASDVAISLVLHAIKSSKVPLAITGHLAKYVSWLEARDAVIKKTSEAQYWALMGTQMRQELLDSIIEEIYERGDHQASALARTIGDLAQTEAARSIFSGRLKLTDVIPDDRLADLQGLYKDRAKADEFIQLCGHSNPSMSVLEIGAGMGRATEKVLQSLTSKDGVRMYGRYVVTDNSPERLESAKERFQDRDQVYFSLLDVGKSVAEQGFEFGTFDLIVASHALHTSRSTSDSLRNLHSLLRPGGRLYLQEPVLPLKWHSLKFALGLLPEWWIGEDDSRTESPFMSVEAWGKELTNAGFTGLDAAVLDDDAPYHCCAHIVSTVAAPASQPDTVTFLYHEGRHEFAIRLATILERFGISIDWRRLEDMDQSAASHDIISTIELEHPFFADISEEVYSNFMNCMSQVKKGVLWLTRAAQVDAVDPSFGIVLGLARTFRSELSLDFWTAELQKLDDAAVVAAVSISRKFWARETLPELRDAEYSVRDGLVWVGRYHWTPTFKSIEAEVRHDHPKQLMVGQYGRLDSLKWVQQDPILVKSDEVEIDIRCVGLNFKDILIALGIVPGPQNGLGIEATGIVTRVGSDVQNVKEGDRVFTLSTGLLRTRKIVHMNTVMLMPPHLSFEEAASMRVAFTTAIYSLMTLGQLEEGQSILIHSAAGGVGQAAIQIAQMLGAEIYATVGSEEKVRYLIDNHKIPRERIFNSRDVSFLDGVMRSTGGRGVDLVLNSLSGDLLHTSWQCVAKYGKMIEIGKRDILEKGTLAMNLFDNNRTFHGVDLQSLLKDRPDVAQRLNKQAIDLLASGAIKPLQPIHVYPANKVSDAFRFMQRGQHIGKIVISMPPKSKEAQNSEEALPVATTIQQVRLSTECTYLIVGGLGGLGQSVATWLVERGAKSILFLSPSAGKRESDQAFFREMQARGCYVTAVAGSVADRNDVDRAIETAPSRIAGVLQMSMVFKDTQLLELSHSDWHTSLDPKVRGTWTLHDAFCDLDAELDFFVLFSSVAGVLGAPYQSSYNSANTFLDSFVQFRHNLGLPCSVVDLGAVDGIGFLAARPDRISAYRDTGIFVLREQHVIDAVHVSILHSLPSPERGYVFVDWETETQSTRRPWTNMSQIVVGLKSTRASSNPVGNLVWDNDARYSVYGNMTTTQEANTDAMDGELQKLLKIVSQDPGMLKHPEMVEIVSMELGLRLFRVMQIPEEQLDVKMTLVSLGIDSLVSIEIRNWLRRLLGVETTVLEIMNAVTVEGLGRLALSMLQEKYGMKEDS